MNGSSLPDWQDIHVGDEHPPLVAAPLTIAAFRQFQALSGDDHPIHHDVEYAQSLGYPGPFAPGMLIAGILATYTAEWMGPENVRRFKVQFREKAWAGDRLTYGGRVAAKRVEGSEHLLDLELHVTSATGERVLRGWASGIVDPTTKA